ncbi:hypothetical protein BGZ82_001916 [Podila clonocystis]|nr:hypothetical protein BGZ82_001916 [Podila clonocystis]
MGGAQSSTGIGISEEEQARLLSRNQDEQSGIPKHERVAAMRLKLVKERTRTILKPKTIEQYAPHLVDFEAFCDASFGGDYMVEPEKIVRFLTEKIYTRTRIQFINLELGYKGVVGLLQHDPQEYPDIALNEKREILP